MEPHTGRAGLASSPSAKASPSTSPASGAGRASLVGSWLLRSLVGKHREGLCAASPAAQGPRVRALQNVPGSGALDTHQVSGMSWTGWPSWERVAAVGGL